MKSLIFIIPLLFTSQSFADFELYRGVRQMGMGGAGVAVVNDETSLLINPTGLGRLRNNFFTMIDPEITNSLEGGEALAGTALVDSASPQPLYDQLDISVDKPYYFKGQVFPSLVVPNFGIGLLGKYEVLARRNSDGTLDFNYINDYVLVTGFNLRFLGGRVKVGVSGKLINRVESFGQRDPATDSLVLDDFASEGMGLGTDVGLTLAAPWVWLPTLSAVLRDAGGTSFSLSEGLFGMAKNGMPSYREQSLDLGIAIFPIIDNHIRSTLTVDYRDALNTSEVDNQLERTHIGMEFNFFDSWFVRAGYGQTYWSAGFEFANDNFQWQLATYGERVNFTGNDPEEDRRWILKFVFRN